MRSATRSHYAAVVQRSIERIVRQLDEALDLDALARDVAVAPFHFHRIFRGMVGETPLELARRLRLERAASRLVETDRPVTEIAFDAGFEAHEAFTRAFRARYDTSPTLFRTRTYPRIELATRSGVHYRADGLVTPFIPRDSGGVQMHVDIATALGVRTSDRPMVAIYHDDPEVVPVEHLRSDAAVVVPDDVPLPDGLSEQHLPAGEFACTLHVGPYEQLGDTWARFMGEWLPASGRCVGTGPSHEIYQNDPRTTPKAELRTTLHIPLE